jgi:hypothetical protein
VAEGRVRGTDVKGPCMKRLVPVLMLAAVVLTLASGCGGKPQASIRYMAGNSDAAVTYDVAVFQLARDQKVQVILYHRVAAPIGTADPDFEYVFFEVPQADSYGWLREDNVPAYRWVHQAGKNLVWRGTAGQIKESMAIDETSMRLRFEVTMEPAAGMPGAPHILSGSIGMDEDIVTAQGLMNRYDEWLRTILGQPPRPKPAAATKSPSPKSPSPAKRPA